MPSRPLLPLRWFDRGGDAPYEHQDAVFWWSVCAVVALLLVAALVIAAV